MPPVSSSSATVFFEKGHHKHLRSRGSKASFTSLESLPSTKGKERGRERGAGPPNSNLGTDSSNLTEEEEDEIDSLIRGSERFDAHTKDGEDEEDDPPEIHGRTSVAQGSDPHPPTSHKHNLSSASSVFSTHHYRSDIRATPNGNRNGSYEQLSSGHPLLKMTILKSALSLVGETSLPKDVNGSVVRNGFGVESVRPSEKTYLDTREFAKEMILQTVPIMVLTVVTGILVGELLEKLQSWQVFVRVEELFILVPILLNLKGNLEMNLASRFSTSANIGELDLRLTRTSLVFGNMALLQVQALFVSFFAGLIAFLLGLTSRTGVTQNSLKPTYKGVKPPLAASQDGLRGGYFECLLVLCASMLAASGSSAVAGSFMCALVILCRKLRINPDNVAAPVASCLGELLTLTILGLVSVAFGLIEGTIISTVVFVALVAFLAFEVALTLRNAYVQELLLSGWTPLFLAMLISCGTGLVLENYVNEYHGFALLALVITGKSSQLHSDPSRADPLPNPSQHAISLNTRPVGTAGNAGAIFVSRISTSLHANATHSERYTMVAVTLTCISTAVLMAFLFLFWVTGHLEFGLGFFFAYFLVVIVVSAISLVLAYQFCMSLWRRDWDPDLNALPLLSSLIDVVGQLLLVVAYSVAGQKMVPSTEVGVGSGMLDGVVGGTGNMTSIGGS